jgi:hypothetical protein
VRSSRRNTLGSNFGGKLAEGELSPDKALPIGGSDDVQGFGLFACSEFT